MGSFSMDSLNSEQEPEFSIFYDFFLDLLSPYLRAAKKKGNQTWPASHILLFGNSATTDFKPEMLEHRANKGQCLRLGIFSKMFLPLEIKGKSN